jgi:SAM-dependent methyltransferase
MDLEALLKSKMKASRKQGRLWVRLLDFARSLLTAERRSIVWTRLVHGDQVHQTTAFTCDDRYPGLFDLAAKLAPNAERIWSFGCSTGEELLALRRRFPTAEIVGSEINPRSLRIARQRVRDDSRIAVVQPRAVEGKFDAVFALAVLQREPHKVAELEIKDLSRRYPFARFDRAVQELADALRAGGLLCVMNAHYRVEDSAAAADLEPVEESPSMEPPLFNPEGGLLDSAIARTVFRKAR